VVERREVEAALEARRELGNEYEPELVEAFLDKIEKRLEERRGPARPEPRRGAITPLALGSIFAAVGATAIATGNDAAWVVPIIWLAIVLVNVAVAFRR
jgi:hypothetical protein